MEAAAAALMAAAAVAAEARREAAEPEEVTQAELARVDYAAAKTAVMDALAAGRTPTRAQYAERDETLYSLPDEDLLEQYKFYFGLYMSEESSPMVKGMAEMVLTKLGERLPAQA